MSTSDRSMLTVARPQRIGNPIELSVIVPAFNEARRLPLVLGALHNHVDDDTTEIIVVDDGSSDDTSKIARESAAWATNLVVLTHAQNRGKGAAVRTGVAAARGDAIAFLDADNATDLTALAPMVAALGPDTGAVFGSRHAPGSSVHGAPALRGVMGRVFNHVVRLAAGTKIRDTQCGAKVFAAPVARLAFAGAGVDGFAFDVEILRRMLAMGVGVIEYPVTWHYVPGTKVLLATPLHMLRDIGRIRLSKRTGAPPYVDATYGPELAPFVDVFAAGESLSAGQPVRVALPFDGSQATDAVRELLPNATPVQASSWSDLFS